MSSQVKYWLEQLAGELHERLTREAELVNLFIILSNFHATTALASAQRLKAKQQRCRCFAVHYSTSIRRSLKWLWPQIDGYDQRVLR